MADVLAVWLLDQAAGKLERTRRSGFRFVPEPAGPRISVTWDEPEPWPPERTAAWFEGVLPEGESRTRIAARFGLSAGDVFGLLEEIGWECAGAVSILPVGQHPTRGRYRALTNADVGARLDALPGRPFDADDAVRASLGGYQSKLVLARRGGASWEEPLDGSPSTHILKPEPPQWPGMAAAEVWSMTLAATATTTAEVALAVDLGTRPVVVVTRFDRLITGDGVRRRHQEDLCQLLGLPPDAKYAEPPLKAWKPSLARLAALLRERGLDPTVELRRLLEQVTVNVAIGNADAHAKNFSVLHEGGGTVRLSPLYDVVPTLPFVPNQVRAAMPVGGKFRLDEIESRHLIEEAAGWGMPSRLAKDTVGVTMARLLEAAAAERTGISVAPRVREAVERQLRRLGATASE
jgi:serine/threonine-protein kinase HipA